MTPEEPTSLRETLENAVDTVIQDPTPEINAPETWADEDKQVFGTIQDPNARQWVIKRDTDLNTRLTETQERYKDFDTIFQPYEERLKTTGQTRSQVVTNLLRAQDILEKSPTEGIQQLVKMFNISPDVILKALGIQKTAASADDQPGDDDPYADLAPALAARMRERDAQLDALLGGQKQTQEAQVAQVRSNLALKAAEFKETKGDDGQPAYPYMTDKRVVDKMSELLKSGIVKVEGTDVTGAYKNAYEQAIYSFADIREKIQTSLDQGRVLRARKAGASPRPDAGASRATPKAGTTVREQLEAAYASKSNDQ